MKKLAYANETLLSEKPKLNKINNKGILTIDAIMVGIIIDLVRNAELKIPLKIL